ncbi:MAG: VOC family protein [Actinomycetota bacterium]
MSRSASGLPVAGTWFQEAYLVDDLERAITAWSDTLGAGPFVVAPHHRCDRFDYRGTDRQADVSYAFGYLGDAMIQFIVQHDDTASIYTDTYPDGPPDGVGFHHLGILVEDFEAEFAKLESAGFECATRLYADRVDAAYFDTRSITGGFTELHGTPTHILDAFAAWRRNHAERTDSTPPIVPR